MAFDNIQLSPFDDYLQNAGLPIESTESISNSSPSIVETKIIESTPLSFKPKVSIDVARYEQFKENLTRAIAPSLNAVLDNSPLFARILEESSKMNEVESRSKRIEWPLGWESKADGYLDQAGLRETWTLMVLIWLYLLQILSKGLSSYTSNLSLFLKPVSTSLVDSKIDDSIIYSTVLSTVTALVSSSYHLESSIVSVLEELIGVENAASAGVGLGIGSDYGLPSPSESNHSNLRRRATSPLGSLGSPFPESSSSQRNQPLRLVLLKTITSITNEFTKTQQKLKLLKPIGKESVLALERARHEAADKKERKEAMEGKAMVEQLWEVRMPAPTSNQNKRRTWDGSAPGALQSLQTNTIEPFTANLSRSISPNSPLKRSLSRQTTNRARPMSMSMLPTHATQGLDSLMVPSTPPQRRRISRPSDSEEEDTLSTAKLEHLLEELRVARKELSFMIISFIEQRTAPGVWEIIRQVAGTVSSLAYAQEEEIVKATKLEFGGLEISTRLDTSTRFDYLPSPTSTSQSHWKRRSLPYPPTQNFGPANSNSTKGPLGSLLGLESKTTAMSTTIRSIVAKLHIVQSDAKSQLRQPRGGVEDEAAIDQLLATHNSIGQDLEMLQRDWMEQRLLLRGVVRRDIKLGLPRDDTFPETESNRELGSIPDIPDEEVSETLFFENSPPEIHSDARNSTYLPPPGLEHIYEATVERERTVDSSRFTREERIKIAKEKRERRQSDQGTSRRSSLQANGNMVAELKDVLTLLKGRSKLAVE